MRPDTLKDLQRFVGKVCTIISTSINRDFSEKIARTHFVTFIESINVDGIWGTNPENSDLVNFYNMEYIVSIHVEEVFDLEKEEHRKILDEAKAIIGEKPKGDIKLKPSLPMVRTKIKPVLDTPFVDLVVLEAIAGSISQKAVSEAIDIMKN